MNRMKKMQIWVKRHEFLSVTLFACVMAALIIMGSAIFELGTMLGIGTESRSATEIKEIESALDECDVDFEDANFAVALASALECEISKLTEEKLADVKSLSITGNSMITRLDDIVLLPNLEELAITYCAVESIEPISQLTNLTSLDLTGNKIENIGNVAQLPNLETLNVSNNQIAQLPFGKKSKANRLKELNISNNSIEDISCLAYLTGLEVLIASSNNISDVSVMPELKNITELNLSSNKIDTMTDLSELSRLEILIISDNNLENISFLKGNKSIVQLDISQNNISDLSELSTCTGLESLSLYGYNKMDLSPLHELPNFNSIYLSQTFDRSEVDFLMGRFNTADKYTKVYLITKMRGLDLYE